MPVPKCTVCLKTFLSNNDLHRHIRATHNEDDYDSCDRPLARATMPRCRVCEDTFSSNNALHTHTRAMHHESTSGVSRVAATASTNDDDDDWTAREFWDAYKDHPDRLKRKAQEKYERFEEREAAKRRKLEETSARRIEALEEEVGLWKRLREEAQVENTRMRELYRNLERSHEELKENLQRGVSNDWLLHRGNIAFCRDRTMFDVYHPISATATAMLMDGGDGRPVDVLGIGKVTIRAQRQHGQPSAPPRSFIGILHIPAAKCNGLPIPRFEMAGWRIKRGPGDRASVADIRTNSAVLCANSSSGRDKICLEGEGDGDGAPRHITCNTAISISADRAHISSLAPQAGLTI